jgi:hypothetical protein
MSKASFRVGHVLSRQDHSKEAICPKRDMRYGVTGSHPTFKIESSNFTFAIYRFVSQFIDILDTQYAGECNVIKRVRDLLEKSFGIGFSVTHNVTFCGE